MMKSRFEAIVIGVSAGGVNALKVILSALKSPLALSVIIVMHRRWNSEDDFFCRMLNKDHVLTVKEVDEKERLAPGIIYLAPPNYHLLIEKNKTLSLTVDVRNNYSRPSIDILFESAAEVFGSHLIGVVLTGANDDGSYGLKSIKAAGGIAVIQDPATAEVSTMPQAALDLLSPDYEVDYVLPLDNIGPLLIELVHPTDKAYL